MTTLLHTQSAMMRRETRGGRLSCSSQINQSQSHGGIPVSIIAFCYGTQACIQGESVVFDGTGNNFERLKAKINNAKKQGYIVNVVVVWAETEQRLRLVRHRQRQIGRYVDDVVVAKGHTKEVWNATLLELNRQGKVSHFVVKDRTVDVTLLPSETRSDT